MTPRKRPENALGKGLDALIRKDYLDEEEERPKNQGKNRQKALVLQKSQKIKKQKLLKLMLAHKYRNHQLPA